MGGGLLQLIARNATDVYLTGNPQISFFKAVYKRHTNFAKESIELNFMGKPDFGKKVDCIIPKNGDLIYKCYLKTTLPNIQIYDPQTNIGWIREIGHFIINNIFRPSLH